MFSEWIRKTAYWTLDFLKGSKVRKHLNDIRNILDNDINSIKAKKYLDEMLKYASETVEFYKPYANFTSIKDFPVINKNIIKQNYDKIQSPEYKNAKVHNLHTSGSTGTPFIVRQDENKRNRVLAEMMYFWRKAGYEIGMRYIFFRIWTDVNRKSRLSAWARNILMCNILRLDDENLENIRALLKKDHKIKMLLGYASTFENLANYLDKCADTPDMFNIDTIISSSEVLNESTRERLIKVFGCNVVSLYSNQENGMLAQECIENKEFHVNTASFYIELLKFDSDEPAEVGEHGRIVITDLFNHAMPLIRYDTGDIGVQKERAECAWKTKVFSSIEGRRVDLIYNTAGVPLSPHTWSVYMWKFDNLKQYQFIQNDAKDYILNVNGAKGVYTDSEIIDHLKSVLGQDANIEICHVSEIPNLASGKFKKTVCNYKPEVSKVE